MIGTARAGMPGQIPADEGGFSEALLGEGMPPEAERHIKAAGRAYHLDDVAETHLHEAQALAPGHVAVLISLYRFYFYKGRLDEALDIARICLTKAAQENNLPPNWRDTKADDAIFCRYEDIAPRFFLFTLKGYAYLQLRLGNMEEGLEAVLKLLELDASDKIGARVLLEIIQRAGEDDE